MNVVYEERDREYPVKVHLSLWEAQALAEALNASRGSPLKTEFRDFATNLVTMLRELCAFSGENLPFD